MDVVYASSTSQGYKQRLKSHNVYLPLKYDLENIDDSNHSAAVAFESSLSTVGRLIDVSDSSSGIDQIAYETDSRMLLVELTPYAFSSNALGLEYRRFIINLRTPLANQNCLSVSFSPAISSHEDGMIVVDLIDSNHLLITTKFHLADFLVLRNARTFNLDFFMDWGHISVPYSFDLASQPYVLKSLDPLNLIVSLYDGNMLHFKRLVILDDFDVYNFNDTLSIILLAFVTSIFSWSRKTRNVSVRGVSSNALVDVVRLEPHYIATLSCSKILRIWDCRTHHAAHSPIELSLDTGTATWLPATAARYLQVFHDASKKQYLALHYLDDKLADGWSGYRVKTLEVQANEEGIIMRDSNFSLKADYPDNLLATNDSKHNTLWFIQDFYAVPSGPNIIYGLLWKSDVFLVIVTYTVNLKEKQCLSSHCSSLAMQDPQNILMFNSEDYMSKVISSGKFEPAVVVAALNVIRGHSGSPKVDAKKCIRHNANETVMHLASKFQGSTALWYKILSLCEEFYKLGERALAFVPKKSGGILVLQSNGLSLFRYSHFYEQFRYKPKESPEGKLVNLLESVNDFLSLRTKHKLNAAIQSSKFKHETDASNIYNSHLAGKISTSESKLIIQKVADIPNVISIINTLLNHASAAPEIRVQTTKLGSLSKIQAISTFRKIQASHVRLLSDLVVLLLICDVNPILLKILNRAAGILRGYSIVDTVFNACFKLTDLNLQLECKNINYSGNSLLWSCVEHHKPEVVVLVRDGNLNEAFDSIVVYFSQVEQYKVFAFDAILELLRRGEAHYIEDQFFNALDSTIISDRFLMGLVYMVTCNTPKFCKAFESDEFLNENLEFLEEKLRSSLSEKAMFNQFLNALFLNETNPQIKRALYFHALSQLAQFHSQQSLRHFHHTKYITPTSIKSIQSILTKELEFVGAALLFEEKAIAELMQDNSMHEEYNSVITSYRINSFELAMFLGDWDHATTTIEKLNASSSTNAVDFEVMFRQLIQKLVQTLNIGQLYKPAGARLYCKYFTLVDHILLDQANSELTLSNLLRIYKYIYSWRLFGTQAWCSDLCDTRGAVEALYIFITRFKSEHYNLVTLTTQTVEDIAQYRLKILELYMIILNCIKSYTCEKDQWIMSTNSEGTMRVMTKSDLELEYHQWLQTLLEDMRDES